MKNEITTPETPTVPPTKGGEGLATTICYPFELGDSVCISHAINHCPAYHKPIIEGTVTARGHNCVRVSWYRKFLWMTAKQQQWFNLLDPYHTIAKVAFL